MLQAFDAALAALLRWVGGNRLDLRLLRLARFLVRSLLSLGHRESPCLDCAVLQHPAWEPSSRMRERKPPRGFPGGGLAFLALRVSGELLLLVLDHRLRQARAGIDR